MIASEVKLDLRPEQVREFDIKERGFDTKALDSLGIGYNNFSRSAMDAFTNTLTEANIMSPVQFLQYILPEPVRVVTADRAIDRLIGRRTVGQWRDDQIVTPVVEGTGNARPYGDTTTTPMANYNVNWEIRTIVRMEEGITVNTLEEERASAVKLNMAREKREAASNSLAIELNRIGFFGFNNGVNKTYGFLNDPNLPAATNVAAGAGGSTWASKTYLEICADIRAAMAKLRVQSGNLIVPNETSMTLAVPASCYEYLTTVSEYGNSVMDWLNKTYPKIRVEAALELDNSAGTALAPVNQFFLFADSFNGHKVFVQNVVQTFRVLGMARYEKGYSEAYSNATAGVMLNMPIGVVRYTGI